VHYGGNASHPVERHRRHAVPGAFEVDVSGLLVDAHDEVVVVHPQGRLHRRLFATQMNSRVTHADRWIHGTLNQITTTKHLVKSRCVYMIADYP